MPARSVFSAFVKHAWIPFLLAQKFMAFLFFVLSVLAIPSMVMYYYGDTFNEDARGADDALATLSLGACEPVDFHISSIHGHSCRSARSYI